MTTARFILLRSADSQFYFVLRAPNNEVILNGETYPTKAVALKSIAAVQANAALDARYERRTSTNGAPYFVLRGGNHEIVGQSELYASTQARDEGIAAVKRHAPTASTVDDA